MPWDSRASTSTATPTADRRASRRAFHSTLVVVPNQGHVTALVDWLGCAAGIVRRFVATKRVSGSECAAENPPLHLVETFPRTSRTAPEAGDESFAVHRRMSWCALQAVADAVARYPLLPGTTGVGLRGGHFSARGAYLSNRPLELRLRGVRFCADVPVSGTVLWHRASGAVRASIRFRRARAVVRWSLASLSPAELRGRTGRAAGAPLVLRLTLPAP
jgi:hypothetical protein